MEILKKTFVLTASDVDCHGLCRLSALLEYLQDMATEHAAVMSLDGPRMLAEYGAVWMMARLHLTLERPIVWPGEIEVHTWHRGAAKSMVVYRDFDLFVGGERVGEATISWVLADVRDRKILKPGSIPPVAESPRPAVVKDCIPEKIKAPAEMTQAMTRTVTYSDTDVNGHMNNTKYADVACDAIRYEQYRGRFISEVRINYQRECFPGDTLLILRGEADGAQYVRGTDDAGRVRFEVCLGLRE